MWAAAHPDIPIGDRLQLVGGEFFESVPAADVYFLKHVSRRETASNPGLWPAKAHHEGASELSRRSDACFPCCTASTCAQILHDWDDSDCIKVSEGAVVAMLPCLAARGPGALQHTLPPFSFPTMLLQPEQRPGTLNNQCPWLSALPQIMKTVRKAAHPQSRVLLCEVREGA